MAARRSTSSRAPSDRHRRPPDVRALSFSDNGDVEAPLVFAGYGIVVPESQGFGYDSYATLDVKDKIVLVLRYFPEDADQKTRGILARYADLRYKAMAGAPARRQGDDRRHRTALPERRRARADEFRHCACRFRHHRGQRHRATWSKQIFDRRPGQDARRRAEVARFSEPARDGIRAPGHRESPCVRCPRKAHRPQRRRIPPARRRR